MRSTVWASSLRAAAAIVGVAALASAIPVAHAKPVPGVRRPRATNLFAAPNLLFDVNRVLCNLVSRGEVCSAGNSPVGGGGFWPKGTPDQYIFNSGLQIAGVIPASAGFAWAGDTVGAFFFDARGDQGSGDPLAGGIYYSLNAADAAAWPNAGVARDTALYHPVLLGRNQVSQGDAFVRYWDGSPSFLGGRTHPVGLVVDQRAMAWNYPTGNESILYFIFTFYNVTARNSAVYNNPTINPALQADLAALGAQFQDLNEQHFSIQIPDQGYPVGDLYAAFAMDADVAVFLDNYSTAILPFNIGMTYSGTFLPEVGWQFPSDVFGPPFYPGSGFVGVKYLRSPANAAGQQIGLTMFSNTTNSAAFPDPQGVRQLFRYLSGNIGSTDPQCSPFSNPVTARARRLCFLAQEQDDARFYQSSGPFVLPPGESRTIVVAYLHGAPTAIVADSVGGDVKPGIPFTGDSIFSDPAKVRFVERVAGWVSQSDANNDQIIQEAEVVTTPRSLLDKARVAQTVYENKFLLPFAPTAPTFFLIPGDNQVTVVWGPSPSETEGDPFFAVASQPLNPDNTPNPLYDQNFQRFDVEGYRIYRGRTSAEMELVAQFDYAGTHLTDFTGSFAYPDEDGDGKLECAPELSLTDDCPTFPHEHEIVGNVIQIPEGGRVQLADSGLLILQADTAVSGGGSGFAELSNTGVPFAFVDVGVRNSFTYVYSVTAYDVNSFVSGPSSLESPKVTKRITPRRVGANVAQTALVQGVFGDGGAELSPSGTWPTIDAANGTFPGLIPPANDANFSLAGAFEVLPMGDIALRVDSVTAGFTGGIFLSPAGQPNLHVTISAAGDTARHVIALPEPAFNGSTAASYRFEYPIVPYDSAGARRFGIAYAGDVRLPISYGGRVPTIRRTSGGVSVAFGRFGLGDSADHFLSHSRWLDATGAEPPDPTIVASADSAHHAGRLTGVGRIYAPSAYRSPGVNLFLRGYSYSQTAWYPADFVVTWNADSSITVRDSTHRVTLPFRASGGSGWGFVNVRAFTAAGVTTVHIEDGSGAPDVANVAYHHVYGTPPTCFDDWWAIPCIDLEQKAQFQPVDFNADGTPDGNGIALLVNGEFFIMEMNQIPAAGTRWRLRAVAGNMGATCAGGFSAAMTDCSGYTFTPPAERPSFVPGLTYRISVSRQYDVDATLAGNVDSVHTVPDPYYVANALELTANNKVLKFVKLPSRALIRIYSVSGVLVNVIAHDDISLGGEATWNLRNRNNQLVASGVYFYHVETPEGHTKTGRFTIVTFAP